MMLVHRTLSLTAAALLAAGSALLVSAPSASAGTGSSARITGAWKQEPIPAGLNHVVLTGASCAWRGGHCLAVGDLCPRKFCGAWEPGRIVVTSTLGRHWTVRAHPASVGSLQAVSCPTASECIVTGIRKASATRTGAILRTGNAGRSWSMTVLSRAPPLTGVSCPSAKECYAVGSSPTGGRSVLISTKNGGRTWKRKALTAGLTSITCASPVRCVALGFGLIMSTTDGGTHWVRRHLPRSTQFLITASCPSAHCIAVGTSLDMAAASEAVSANSGMSWTAGRGPEFMSELSAIWCPSNTQCAAVGISITNAPGIVVTTNSGRTWANSRIPAQAVALHGVTCTRASRCIAVGQQRNGPLILANR